MLGWGDAAAGPPRRRPYSRRLRSIHAVFSWTCMRWVSRSAVAWSSASAAAGKAARAVRTTVSWASTSRRIIVTASGGRHPRGSLSAPRTRGSCPARAPEGPDALGDLIHHQGQLRVVRLEHHVKRLEHGSGDVPVVLVVFR